MARKSGHPARQGFAERVAKHYRLSERKGDSEMPRFLCMLGCFVLWLFAVEGWARDYFPNFENRVNPIYKKAEDQLKKLDPTVKESTVRQILRDFDDEALQPIINDLKRGVVPPLFAGYMADLERQARRKKKALPGKLSSILRSHYKSIDLDRVRYAEEINTWHGQAITIGDTIYFPVQIDLENRADIHWMLHELEHVSQYDKVGGVSAFLAKYMFQGGLHAINNGSFNVHDQIELEQDAENKADRIINDVANALDAPESRPVRGPHIVDLKIIAGDDPWVPVPPGYSKDPIDLNWGAKGKYIYLCYKYGTGRGISHIDVIVGNSSGVRAKEGYKKDPIDLNWGSGGKYIYLTFKRGDDDLVRKVKVVASDNEKVNGPNGYRGGKDDLNDGAGGKYIYLFYK
jgi:hypothetical protein